MNPLVTVLLPVYNAEKYLAEAVESILTQTFRDYELLIINDGSTDRSAEIIRSFQDKRVRLVTNETNLKLIATLNKGIELARGKYIVRMDADDISLPERLQKQVDFMETHPEVGVCGTWFAPLGRSGRIVQYPENDESIRIMMLYQTPFCHPSVILRKEVIEKNKISYSSNFIHCEDYELWARLSSHTRFANIPEALLQYRLHENSISASNQGIQRGKTYDVIRLVFQKTGLTVRNEEIDVFRAVAYSQFKPEKNFIVQTDELLTQLIVANKKTKYLPEKELCEFAFQKWLHLCYNTTALGKWVHERFWNSKLSGLQQLNPAMQFKFYLKAILKKG